MGLDMYLYKKTAASTAIPALAPSQPNAPRVQVFYWRKANAVHNFFEQNCPGLDNNRPVAVTAPVLEDLLHRCQRVLTASRLIPGRITAGYSIDAAGQKQHTYVSGHVIQNAGVARALLPTTSGFFFGSTDYDQDYIADITATRDMLQGLLAAPDAASAAYEYCADW